MPSSSSRPLIAVGLWVSGGVDSYLGPILVLPALYVAYFFPPRYAWPLAVIEIATYATPFVYSDAHHAGLLEDTFGHTTGDGVLRDIASRTRSAIRATDTLARSGDASSLGSRRTLRPRARTGSPLLCTTRSSGSSRRPARRR